MQCSWMSRELGIWNYISENTGKAGFWKADCFHMWIEATVVLEVIGDVGYGGGLGEGGMASRGETWQ